MAWTMFYLFVFLKLPILGLGWIVWWAVHAQPDPEPAVEPAGEPGDDGGPRRRRHPPGPLPRPPRRGPHGEPAPAAPPRIRSTSARGRRIAHHW